MTVDTCAHFAGTWKGRNENCVQAVMARGGTFLEAPVCGSRVPALEGQLTILTSGDRKLYDDCFSCFEAMGRKSFYLGSELFGFLCVGQELLLEIKSDNFTYLGMVDEESLYTPPPHTHTHTHRYLIFVDRLSHYGICLQHGTGCTDN